MNRFQTMKLHMSLAGFLLPFALLYFISGALYTLDVKGSIKKREIAVSLSQPFRADIDRLEEKAISILEENRLPNPSGEPSLKKKKGGYRLYWSSRRYSVTMEWNKKRPGELLLIHRERSPLAQVMRIHRAESGTAFKTMGIVLVSGLLIIFASGIRMAQAVPKLRKPLITSLAGGVLSLLLLWAL